MKPIRLGQSILLVLGVFVLATSLPVPLPGSAFARPVDDDLRTIFEHRSVTIHVDQPGTYRTHHYHQPAQPPAIDDADDNLLPRIITSDDLAQRAGIIPDAAVRVSSSGEVGSSGPMISMPSSWMIHPTIPPPR